LPDFPPVRFLASSFLGEVALEDLDPEPAIPLERPGGAKAAFFPLRSYFQGIEQVIRKNRGAPLRGALETRCGQAVKLAEIQEIRIYSEKHGSDYHPAKIEVQLRDAVLPFAMNVALTERGRRVLTGEFQVLRTLKEKYAFPYVPRAYFMEETSAACGPEGSPPPRMYLADWLEGFYEFHLSVDPADGIQKLVLWDTAEHNHYLTAGATDQVYREVARILTACYDLNTFSQIYPWHLAAGDFIARVEAGRVAVRLVAARNYGPLIGPPDLPPAEALLFFLLNLLMRIRLDRLEGVGDLARADEGCLLPAFAGFFSALAEKEQTGEIARGFSSGFCAYLMNLSMEDLEVCSEALLASIDPGSPDRAIIKVQMEQQRRRFFGLVRELGPKMAKAGEKGSGFVPIGSAEMTGKGAKRL
jgi:hypothetical protein